MNDEVVIARPPCQALSARFRRPQLDVWSIHQSEPVEVTGAARADYERELRVSALGILVCSPAATPLWRRVCKAEMYREIRARSDDQRIALELAVKESMR